MFAGRRSRTFWFGTSSPLDRDQGCWTRCDLLNSHERRSHAVGVLCSVAIAAFQPEVHSSISSSLGSLLSVNKAVSAVLSQRLLGTSSSAKLSG